MHVITSVYVHTRCAGQDCESVTASLARCSQFARSGRSSMIRKKFIAESRDRASLYANACTIGTSRPRPFSDELMLFATCHVVTYKMFVNLVTTRGKSACAGTRRYGVPADAIRMDDCKKANCYVA